MYRRSYCCQEALVCPTARVKGLNSASLRSDWRDAGAVRELVSPDSHHDVQIRERCGRFLVWREYDLQLPCAPTPGVPLRPPAARRARRDPSRPPPSSALPPIAAAVGSTSCPCRAPLLNGPSGQICLRPPRPFRCRPPRSRRTRPTRHKGPWRRHRRCCRRRLGAGTDGVGARAHGIPRTRGRPACTIHCLLPSSFVRLLPAWHLDAWV